MFATEPTTTPAAAEPAPAAEPTVWVSDFSDLTGYEGDRVMRMVGATADQVGAHAMSVACATAVVIAQREFPHIPDARWKTLKMSDLVMPEDQEDDGQEAADPTVPGSDAGSTSPVSGASRLTRWRN